MLGKQPTTVLKEVLMSRDAHVSGSQPEKLVACDGQGLEEDCLCETEKKKGKKGKERKKTVKEKGRY